MPEVLSYRLAAFHVGKLSNAPYDPWAWRSTTIATATGMRYVTFLRRSNTDSSHLRRSRTTPSSGAPRSSFAAQRLLVTGLHVTDDDEPYDGVGPLARAAYESAIFGAWLLGDTGRLDILQGDLTRSHEIAVRESWRDGDPPAGIAALLDLYRERYPPVQRPSLDQMVNQVVEWVSESEPVWAYRLDPDARTREPVRHDGEPYRSSYGALYRMLSTYEVHGLGTVQRWIDLEGRTVHPPSPAWPEPTEVLVLVGAIVADVASRLFGYRPLRPGSFDRTSEDFLEWEAGSMLLRAAARAVADDDPSEWVDSLGGPAS